jgi:uncharacterized membrane protein YfcA
VILALLGAALIGVSLGLLGSGGSIVTVPLLVYVVGHSEKASIAESLAIVGIISLFGAIVRARAHEVDWRSVVIFGPLTMVGAFAGGALSDFLTGPVQLLILAVIMLGAAVLMARPPKLEPAGAERTSGVAALAAAGLGVGIVTGLVGIGGGFMIVPALVLVGGLKMQRAIGTSLTLIFLNCVAGFASHLRVLDSSETVVDWVTILIFGALGVAGSIAGRSIGKRLNQKTLRRIFAIFILLIALWMLIRESMKLWG